MINQSSQLKNLIQSYKNVIPSHLCSDTIREVNQYEWSQHTWYNPNTDEFYTEENSDPDSLVHDGPIIRVQRTLTPIVKECVREYQKQFHHELCQPIVNKITKFKYNRYQQGQELRLHYDHIYDIFDGERKGIPVLSIILNFNDEYEGGDLCFWDNFKLRLSEGECIIFPSLFLYPHSITPISNGTRYSAICWAY